MADTPYPIPRELRQTDILAGDGGATYGPFAFRVFDTVDIVAYLRLEDELDFAETAVTVEKVGVDLPLDFFTVTFAVDIGASDHFVIASTRLHERSAGIGKGTQLDQAALEKELSKQGTVLQEQRRDLGRAIKVVFGQDPQSLPAPAPGKVLGWSSGGHIANLVSFAPGDIAFGDVGEDLAGTGTQAEAQAAIGLPSGLVGRSLLAEEGVAGAVAVLQLTYIADYGSHTIPLRKFRTTYVDPANWSPVLQAAGDSGEPCIRVHADDETTFADQWSIEEPGQKWVGEGMDNKSYLRRTTDVNEAAILVMAERCGMRHIGLKGVDYTNGLGVAKTAANAGILVARPAGQKTDLDFEFRNGYISEFYYGVSSRGRGVTVTDNLISACRYACNWDWPAPGTYDGDDFVGDQDGNGYRRLVFARNEIHSIAVAAVRNRGDVGGTAQAANIHCVIENNKSNFGKGMFAGYLGDGSVISGNVIQNANFVGFELDGGTNWVMANNRMYADRTAGGFPEPQSFIKMTGQHTGFVIDGFSARGTTKPSLLPDACGIDMRDGDFVGLLSRIDLAAIGNGALAVSDGIFVSGTGANTEITVDGVTLRNASAARSVIRMVTAGSVLKHRGIIPLGAATPATSGAGTITAV